MNGLTQINIFKQRRTKIKEFSDLMNESSKAIIGFDVASRGFGFYEAIIGIVLMFTGLFMGIGLISP